MLYTSCADGPGSPRGFYLRYGFTDTGRLMWGENVLALDLAAGARQHPYGLTLFAQNGSAVVIQMGYDGMSLPSSSLQAAP